MITGVLTTPLTFQNVFWGLEKGILKNGPKLFCNKDVTDEEIRGANQFSENNNYDIFAKLKMKTQPRIKRHSVIKNSVQDAIPSW